jgi:hypothetical protein
MISAMRCRLVAASIVFWAGSGFAQPAPEGAQPKVQQNALPPAQTVDAVVLIMLVKSTILAVQHANATGNYSVLRDLGTPVFRERFDQAKLTAIFANLRTRGVNLTPVIMLPVNWTKQPEITPQGQLHLAGIVPSQPLQVQFELLFLQLDGVWRLDGIAIDAVPPPAAQASAVPAPAQSPPATPVKPDKKR